MFGIWRRGSAVVVPAVAALALLLTSRAARAGEAEAVRSRQAGDTTTLFGLAGEVGSQPVDDAAPIEWAQVPIERVWAADYHPETDRWSERNNRVKLSVYGAGLFFSGNTRIFHDGGVGARIAWEVPGFISIRLDSTVAPFSHMRTTHGVQPANSTAHDSTRSVGGFVDVTSLSVGIFNPELSAAPNLAMWAGFGVDAWFYHYDALHAVIRRDLANSPLVSSRVSYVDQNIGGNIFFDLEYKITDIFHVGLTLREHVVYAPQIELGEFYKLDNHAINGFHHSRAQGLPFPVTLVHEIQLSASVVF